MQVLCIVPCSQRKIWDKEPDKGPVPAREAYTGVLTRYAISYAEKFCDAWVVLSAKHGLLLPEERVPGPYDATFKRRRGANIIPIDELRRQAAEKGLYSYDKVVVLAGKAYAEVARRVFGERVVWPLRGLGYGEKVRALKKAVGENRPLH
ncbi:MAG: DUF6884 domain-containing protein [Pyrodictiaceae archaeon]